MIGVRIHNPGRATVPMYWWSNIAVRQTPGLRVLAPATRAFRTSYAGRLDTVDIPGDPDTSYPARGIDAADFFYDEAEPWIAAVDETGYGLIQSSTPLLRGRKLFRWGESVGGHHWQEWLGGPDSQPYCEIQAGLARTQYEHLPLPAGAEFSWVESYGPVIVDPSVVHGDWAAALNAVRPERSVQRPEHPIGEVERLYAGSGWGALEQRRRVVAGEPPLDVDFPEDTLGEDQRPWLELLVTGVFPGAATYVTGGDWAERLAAAPRNWARSYHLGVLAHAAGDFAEAHDHYRRSLALAETPWAYRALAMIENDPAGFLAAYALAPEIWQLAVETAGALGKDPAAALEFIAGLPSEQRELGRIKLAEVRAALALGDRERAARVLREGVEVADLREGEVSLDELWSAACPDEPLPPRYDFRMNA